MSIHFSIRVIIINILIFIFGMIIIELIFGNWFGNKNYGNLLLNINKSKIINNLPYKSNKPALYTTDKHGFRANDYSLKDISILIIGGSTTEEKLTDDKLIWTKKLENYLNSVNNKTLNAGVGGQTSFGHVKIFDLWLSRFEELKPKITLFYIGINDALFLVENLNKSTVYEKGRSIRSVNRDLLIRDNSLDNIIQLLKNNSAIVLFFKMIKGNWISLKYNFGYFKIPSMWNQDYEPNAYNNLYIDEQKILNYLSKYDSNLNQLISNSINLNSVPILITQNVSKDHWIYEPLKIINNYTLKYCRLNRVICIDLAHKINLNKSDFYDGIHTNPNGSDKVAKFISDKINLFNIN